MIICLLALSTSPPAWWLRRVNQIWQNQGLHLFWQLSKYQDPSILSAPTLVKSLNDINMWRSYSSVPVLRVANITGGTKNDYLWKIDPLTQSDNQIDKLTLTNKDIWDHLRGVHTQGKVVSRNSVNSAAKGYPTLSSIMVEPTQLYQSTYLCITYLIYSYFIDSITVLKNICLNGLHFYIFQFEE